MDSAISVTEIVEICLEKVCMKKRQIAPLLEISNLLMEDLERVLQLETFENIS